MSKKHTHTRIQSRFCTRLLIPRSSAERGVSPRSRSANEATGRGYLPQHLHPRVPATCAAATLGTATSGWRLCTTPSPLFSLTCIHKFPILQQHLLADGISTLSGLHRVFAITLLFPSCRPCFFFPFPSRTSRRSAPVVKPANACRRFQCRRRLQFPRYLARRSPLLRLQLLARFPGLASRSRPLVAALISLPSPQPTPSLPAEALGLRFCRRRVFAAASLWARKAQHLVAILQRKSRYSNLPPSLASHNLRIWVLPSNLHFVIRSLCSRHAGQGITDRSPLQHRRSIASPPSRDRQTI